jgi:hypothetical protein
MTGEHRATTGGENPGGDCNLEDTMRLAIWRTRGQPMGRAGRSALAGDSRKQLEQRQGDFSEKHFPPN